MDNFKRGNICIACLDPTVGAKIKKMRPVLIVSNDYNNEFSKTVTVLPITDFGRRVYPFEVELSANQSGLDKHSKIKCQQIRTIDKSRIRKKIGSTNRDFMLKIDQALLIHLGIK